jgi:hypothetical protein
LASVDAMLLPAAKSDHDNYVKFKPLAQSGRSITFFGDNRNASMNIPSTPSRSWNSSFSYSEVLYRKHFVEDSYGLSPIPALFPRSRSNSTFSIAEKNSAAEEKNEVVVVVDTFSTGAYLVHRLVQQGYKVVRLLSADLSSDLLDMVLEGLNLRYEASIIYDNSNDDNDDANKGHITASIAITYNKREAYFSKPHLIERRTNRRGLHQPSSIQRQSSCIWCCRIDHSTGERHTRHGRKTTWVCSTCDVPLCKRPRFNGQSCFVLFHQSETLFDPCLAEAQGVQVTVRSHGNRRALPGRKAEPMVAGSSNSDDDDDESSYEPPVTRQRMCSTITVPVRSTRRTCL